LSASLCLSLSSPKYPNPLPAFFIERLALLFLVLAEPGLDPFERLVKADVGLLLFIVDYWAPY